MSDSTNKHMDQLNKKDIILVVCLLLVAGVCYLAFHYGSGGEEVMIWLDGREYGVYDINVDQTIKVESVETNEKNSSNEPKASEKGYNVVVIENGEVYIKDANCPDQYCMKQGKTKDANKSLICLPHKLVVEVHKDAEEALDAVAQ